MPPGHAGSTESTQRVANSRRTCAVNIGVYNIFCNAAKRGSCYLQRIVPPKSENEPRTVYLQVPYLYRNLQGVVQLERRRHAVRSQSSRRVACIEICKGSAPERAKRREACHIRDPSGTSMVIHRGSPDRARPRSDSNTIKERERKQEYRDIVSSHKKRSTSAENPSPMPSGTLSLPLSRYIYIYIYIC